MCCYPAFILELLKVFDLMTEILAFFSAKEKHLLLLGIAHKKNTRSERVTDDSV